MNKKHVHSACKKISHKLIFLQLLKNKKKLDFCWIMSAFDLRIILVWCEKFQLNSAIFDYLAHSEWSACTYMWVDCHMADFVEKT